jgi:hypothetical protein
VHLIDPKAEERGQIDLRVRWLEVPRAGKKPQRLVRFEMGRGGTTVVCGQDRDGPWHLVQDQPRDLTGAEYTNDLATFQRRRNMLEQLLRFLSPGDVVRELQRPLPIADAELFVDRTQPKLACRTLSGRLATFPLVHEERTDGPVQACFWVDKATGRLAALDVWPMRGDERDDAKGERVLLLDLRESSGLLVPFELKHLFRDAQGQLRPNSRAVLQDLRLQPELRAEDFDRTK